MRTVLGSPESSRGGNDLQHCKCILGTAAEGKPQWWSRIGADLGGDFYQFIDGRTLFLFRNPENTSGSWEMAQADIVSGIWKGLRGGFGPRVGGS